MKSTKRYYTSCEFLPLWNFFKIHSGNGQGLKYLVVITDRLDYDELHVAPEELVELQELWLKVFQEYNALEKNYGVNNFVSERTKIIYYFTLYIQERAMIQSLLYKTNAGYIRELRQRGYKLSNVSQIAYWQSLTDALKQVENHKTYIDILQEKIKAVDGDSKKEGNPFDSIMAWILSNDIRVDDTLTVARYIKIKEIIHQRIKAKQQQQNKNPNYAG